ncbi:MAG TPA: bifunctional DNA primase/polymerase [Streptosporangiaceae bacterium]|nr:bifunctional DNA primase/polymerase [Streptosporangiaceae bacterium]
MNTRDAAIAAARRGWHVFPCRPDGKRPAVPDSWEDRACADPGRVERFWPSPRHNIGIACGPSRLVVVDLDTHGELPGDWRQPGIRDGRDVLAQLCEWARQPWPATRWVATPSGGWHLYFAAPDGGEIRNSAGLLGPQVDVRASGGYVIGAGSAVGGKPYEVLDDMPPAPLPGWIYRMLTPPREVSRVPVRGGTGSGEARLRGLADTVRAGRAGDRTGPLVWAAHRLAEMIAEGHAIPDDGELLVRAAVEAGIRGGERYARGQVEHVLGAAW